MKVNEKIENWYDENKRELPFRKTNDPYSIWVSEIMAQQTRIDTMIPYYNRWMTKWPTIESLANADINDVLHLWQGLGYYNRARKLHEGAITIKERFNGIFPNNLDDILSINGIGEYTAGAILSVCFNKEQPAVDGNVFRVVTRVKAWDDDITKQATRKKVTMLCAKWMKDSQPSKFTQGLMEIGAMVCTPKNPSCLLCPLVDDCKAHKLGEEEKYPVKTKAKAPQELEVYTYVLINNDEICISQDDSDGLMKDLYRLPQFSSALNIETTKLKKRKHVFSHRIWQMNCFYKELDNKIQLDHCKWIKINDLKQYPLVTAHKKLLISVIGKHIF
ncbi:A/G-specific adenine glycosylase [Anaerorhabdus sp.]|jgi:A/G-specific adenine glycosylase|uniref:A/G-specific adenine glycosylase n=1 Tax=Anaerorhabdus sp. TaxID=1872524 RepID=UPI002FC912EF